MLPAGNEKGTSESNVLESDGFFAETEIIVPRGAKLIASSRLENASKPQV